MTVNAVGIDVSNGHSTIAVIRPLGEVVELPFEVRHTPKSLSALAEQLKSYEGETRVILEHTGRYYESIANVLHENGLWVSAVNPLLVKEYGNNWLRRVKTDKADAKKLARYGLDNWTALREYTGMDETRYNLKTLNRQFQLASRQRTESANHLISLLEQSLPGIRKLFDSPPKKDGHQKWVDFVSRFYHAGCVRGVTLKKFTKLYHKGCKEEKYNFSEEKTAEIYAAAQEMVVLVPMTPLHQLMVQQAAQQLTAISCSVETCRAEMNRLASQLPEYPVVMEMFGVGSSLGPQLMAEIGDTTRFAGKQSLVAFAGVDPMPNQSGEKNVRSNKSSKRGSSYLRKALFNVMDVYIKRSPQEKPVYQFLDKKRREGKPYYVYMTAGANKFLRIYYAKVRDYLKHLDVSDVDNGQNSGTPAPSQTC